MSAGSAGAGKLKRNRLMPICEGNVFDFKAVQKYVNRRLLRESTERRGNRGSE
jgi:hypothetical protein